MEKHVRRSDYNSTEEFCDAMSLFFEDCPNATIVIDDITPELEQEMEAFGFAGDPPSDDEIEEFKLSLGIVEEDEEDGQ